MVEMGECDNEGMKEEWNGGNGEMRECDNEGMKELQIILFLAW